MSESSQCPAVLARSHPAPSPLRSLRRLQNAERRLISYDAAKRRLRVWRIAAGFATSSHGASSSRLWEIWNSFTKPDRVCQPLAPDRAARCCTPPAAQSTPLARHRPPDAASRPCQTESCTPARHARPRPHSRSRWEPPPTLALGFENFSVALELCWAGNSRRWITKPLG
jgi:hypothetical protein